MSSLYSPFPAIMPVPCIRKEAYLTPQFGTPQPIPISLSPPFPLPAQQIPLPIQFPVRFPIRPSGTFMPQVGAGFFPYPDNAKALEEIKQFRGDVVDLKNRNQAVQNSLAHPEHTPRLEFPQRKSLFQGHKIDPPKAACFGGLLGLLVICPPLWPLAGLLGGYYGAKYINAHTHPDKTTSADNRNTAASPHESDTDSADREPDVDI